MHDLDVQVPVDAPVRHYNAEEEQRQPPAAELANRARRLFTSVRTVLPVAAEPKSATRPPGFEILPAA